MKHSLFRFSAGSTMSLNGERNQPKTSSIAIHQLLGEKATQRLLKKNIWTLRTRASHAERGLVLAVQTDAIRILLISV